MEREALEKMMEECLAKLGEHFDAVQILATRHEDKKSESIHKGTGNWYARFGMVHEFINKETAQENAVALIKKCGPKNE